MTLLIIPEKPRAAISAATILPLATANARTAATPLTCRRDDYGAIRALSHELGPDAIIQRFDGALPELGITRVPLSGRARRTHGKTGWHAVNADLYGWDPEQDVAVVQIRQSETDAYGITVRKDYAVIGRNETGTVFRHPIAASAVHGAIRANGDDPVAVVRRAQRWMWRCTSRQLEDSLAKGMRQGDVLMITVRGEPRGMPIDVADYVIGGSHRVVAPAFRADTANKQAVYALSPKLLHIKDQHAPVYCDWDGWHSIRLAREAPAWEIAALVGD